MQESNKRLKTKRTIENAMVQLLMEQPFDKISTVKLVEKAGISRSSFYTHYKEEHSCVPFYLYSASRTRTYDIMINSHALLPTELWRIK